MAGRPRPIGSRGGDETIGAAVNDTLTGHLTVATCIGCGARSRAGECPDGCADVALDLVDLVDVAEWTEALEARVAALRELALAVAGDPPFTWRRCTSRPARRSGCRCPPSRTSR